MSNHDLRQAIADAGGWSAVARACGVKYQSVQSWTVKGMPRTEWTGETHYTDVLRAMVAKKKGKAPAKESIQWRP